MNYESRSKYLERLFRFFPLLHLTLITVCTIDFIISVNYFKALNIIVVVYVLPVIIWRALFSNIREGRQPLGRKSAKGSTWLISHYLQYVFIALPFFERILIVIPGAYSLWLRAWGSSIGKGVVWAPNVEVSDRSLLEVGDYSFIGGYTLIGSHYLKRRNGLLSSHIGKVVIGKKAIIGCGAILGPGAIVADEELLPAQSSSVYGQTVRPTYERHKKRVF